MARKEFIGISSEYNRLRLARVLAVKGGIELLGVETLDLPYPVSRITDSSSDPMSMTEDFDDLFEADTGPRETATEFPGLEGTADEAKSSKGKKSLEDEFDMTQMDEDSDVIADNEKLLADYLSKFGNKKFQLGLHIPFGKTTFQFVKNVNPDKMKKSERQEFFIEKLRPIHNEDPEPDHYSWVNTGDDSCLIAYNRDDTALINLVEVAETYYNGKLLITERLPDESIWAGLVRTNYNLDPEDITGIIAIGESSSRIIFMKGSQIFNILPIIPDGENSNDILNTIFSKILFEIDKGELPKINRILLARSAKLSEKAKPYFEKQFEDVEVDYLTLNPKNATFADEILDSPLYLQPYMSAIGAAWAASRTNEKEFSQLTLLPEYIKEKQRALKIAWHGIIILVLIALTPLFLNTLYNEKAEELQNLEQQVRTVENQIEDLRPIATMTEDLITDLQLIHSENDRLLELARYSQKWSEIMNILNEGVAEIPQIWLTSLRTSDQHINLTGISLTREQIPVLAHLFSDANIQQVSETELRGQQVYSFAIQANNFLQDIDEFLLDMPEVEFDFERNNMIELDLSYTPEQDAAPERQFASNQNNLTNNGNNDTPSVPIRSADNQASNNVAERAAVESEAEEVTGDESETENVPEVTGERSGPAVESTEPVSAPGEQEQVPAVQSQLSANQIPDNSNSTISPYGLHGSESEILYGAYTIVLHSIPNSERAEYEFNNLKEEGYKATLWEAELEDGQYNWRIGVGLFETVDDAQKAVTELPEPYQNNHFIIRIR